MEILNFIGVLWHRKWIVIVTLVTTVAVVTIASILTPPVYASTALLRLEPYAIGSVEYSEYLYAERLMQTYTTLAKTDLLLDEIQGALDLPDPPDVSVEPLLGTELLQVTGRHVYPETAMAIADGMADLLANQYWEDRQGGTNNLELLQNQIDNLDQEIRTLRASYIAALERPDDATVSRLAREIAARTAAYDRIVEQYELTQLASGIRSNTVTVAAPATRPFSPVFPKTKINIAISIVVGLVTGVAIAFVIETIDTRIHSPREIQALVPAPVLGYVPNLSVKKVRSSYQRGYPLALSDGAYFESFSRILTNILGMGRKESVKKIVFTSAEPGEGTTTMAINLAQSLVLLGHKVVLIDTNLHHPTLHLALDLSNKTGLTTLLENHQTDETLNDVLQENNGLWILTSGPATQRQPGELLATPAMADIIEELNKKFSFVLIDSPSMSVANDAAILAPTVDGAVLVVGQSKAHREAVRTAVDRLSRSGVKPLGVVVNRAEETVIAPVSRRIVSSSLRIGSGSKEEKEEEEEEIIVVEEEE